VRGGYTVRPGDTLSGLAAGAGVSTAAMAAMNGLDPDGVLVAGTVIKLPGGAPRPGAGRPPAPAPVVPAADPGAHADPRRRRRHPVRRRPARRLPLARRGDRVAGERLQQRDGLRPTRAA
jgi:LysM repeat protein